MVKARMVTAAVAAAVVLGACSGSGGGDAEKAAGAKQAGGVAETTGAEIKVDGALSLSEALMLSPEGGLNPTVAVAPGSGTVFMSWAEEVAGGPGGEGHGAVRRAVVARSEDGGQTFGPPVAASAPGERVTTSTVSPTRVALGPQGEVYLLYGYEIPGADPDVFEHGQAGLRLVRSDDRGGSFGAPVEVAPAKSAKTTMGMSNLFVAADGDVFVSWLDDREVIADKIAKKGKPAEGGHHHEAAPPTQLRMARSSDGGRSFGPSVLVHKPVSAGVGTQMAQGQSGALFITTRSEETPKGSYDAVRDLFVSASTDEGQTWSAAKKVHDDGFKVSGSPENTSALVADDGGRLHVAWYTGTAGGTGPGVYYAVSDDGGDTFTKPVALLKDTWVPYSDAKLAVDDAGHAWVAFEDRRGDEDQIVLARLGPGGRLEMSKAWPGSAPDLATVGGKALVTWNTLPPVAEREQEHNLSGGIRALLASPSGKG